MGRVAFVLYAALVAGASGCRALLPLPADEEEIRLTVLKLALPTDSRGELELRLSVPNPEPRPMRVVGVAWELFLDGRYFAAGLVEVEAPLAPRQRGEVRLDAPLAFRRVKRTVDRVQRTAALRGRLRVAVGNTQWWRPFTAYTVLEGENLPAFAPDEQQ